MIRPEPKVLELDQYFTTEDDAELMVRQAGLRFGQTFLDPCCGDGVILDAGLVAGAQPHGIEIDQRWADWVEETKQHMVVCEDFLKVKPPPSRERKFDHVITNPAFSLNKKDIGLDGRILQHSMRFAHRITAMIRVNGLFGAGPIRARVGPRDHREAHAFPLPQDLP